MLLSSHDKAGNREPAQATIEKLVRHYPEANAWLLLLQEVKSEHLDARQKLHFFRLKESTGNLKHGRDFMTYSDAATSLGLPGESRRVLETAMTAKVFEQESDRSRADQHLTAARERAEAHLAELLELESEATAAATGNEFVALGMAHFSFGQYPKAIEALKAGIAKGGLRNTADAQLTLGAAQLKAGQKAEAAQTLKAINAGDEVTQRIARLWALHAG
jgi:tetratricopeptide (TPR) repeat protein